MNKFIRFCSALTLFVLTIAYPALDVLAQSSKDLVTKANALAAEGKTEEALKLYEEVIAQEPIDQTAQYNKALLQYRAGEWEAAREAFDKATRDPQPELRASAHYNLGNTRYRQVLDTLNTLASEELSQENAASRKELRNQAKTQLSQAIQDYRRALAANQRMDDARANVELAAKLIRQLNEQQEQEDQQQEEDQQQNGDQDQENQDQEQNGDQDQENQDQEQNGDQDQENQDQEQNGDQDQENQDQEQNGDQDQENQDQEQNGDQDQENQDQEQNGEQDQENQGQEQNGEQDQENQDQLQNGEQDQGDQTQEQNGDQDQENQSEQQNGEQEQENQDQQETPRQNPTEADGGLKPTDTMSEQEAERLLQEIRDRALRQRQAEYERRARERRSGNYDW